MLFPLSTYDRQGERKIPKEKFLLGCKENQAEILYKYHVDFETIFFFILMNINCINIFCQRYIIQTNENHRNILMVIPWRPLAKLNVQFKRDSILFLFYLNNMLFSNWWLFIVYKQTKCIKDGKTSQNHSRHFTRER